MISCSMTGNYLEGSFSHEGSHQHLLGGGGIQNMGLNQHNTRGQGTCPGFLLVAISLLLLLSISFADGIIKVLVP